MRNHEADRFPTARRRRLFLTPGLVLGLALAASACSSSSPSSSSTTTASTAATGQPTSGAAAQAAVASAWTAFFDAKTPVARRIALLQDGSAFASIIHAQAGSVLAQAASAKVTNVTVVSPTQAKVTYAIVVGGTPELTQTGVAVYSAGAWQVGVASFCGLLALENGGNTSSLPAACKAATSTS